jgi:U4/U6.U5 tri-snRNP component SNU23
VCVCECVCVCERELVRLSRRDTMAGRLKAVDATARTTWDEEEYARKAKERKELRERKPEKDEAPKALLQKRDLKLEIEGKIGRTQVVGANSETGTGGFFCELCDVTLKDSMTYLNHINGEKHLAKMGMSLEVERSTLQQVQERIERNKRILEQNRSAKTPTRADFEKHIKEV